MNTPASTRLTVSSTAPWKLSLTGANSVIPWEDNLVQPWEETLCIKCTQGSLEFKLDEIKFIHNGKPCANSLVDANLALPHVFEYK